MRHCSFVVVFQTLVLSVLGATTALAQEDSHSALTSMETKWLNAGSSVLNYADQLGLPIDVVVQPQAAAGDVPLAMGVEDGRCKLVLSMRGNPDAEATLATLPVDLQPTAIEAMIAHEVAHCWRFVNGMWHALPAGFIETTADASAPTNVGEELAAKQKAMRDTRREEGFADLVGLAWTLRAHPDQYAAIHAWFERVRAEPIVGSYHDTRVWLDLASPRAFAPAATLFDQANRLWAQGLLVL